VSKLPDGSDLIMVTIMREGAGRRVVIHRKVDGVPVVTKATLKSEPQRGRLVQDIIEAAPETETFLPS
jgi:hypothetical protein